jgi:hypothetical protein
VLNSKGKSSNTSFPFFYSEENVHIHFGNMNYFLSLSGAMGGCDIPRRIVYNDEQYQVKLARPALVKDEPVYANNKPEHYAVSTKYPGDRQLGTISKIPAASPRRSYMTHDQNQV